MKAEVHLLPGPDDPAVKDERFQADLSQFAKGLRDAKIEHTQRVMFFDSGNALGFPLPEFDILLNPAIVGPLCGLLGAWLHARYGRRVRIKIGDVEAEGRDLSEIDALLKRAEKYQKRAAPDDDAN